MKTVIVRNNQSLWDIAIQVYGTVEAVFDLAMGNGLGITDVLTAGQVLNVPESQYTNADVVAYYKKNDLYPVSGNYDLSLFELELKNYDDMRIEFEWGNTGANTPPDMTQAINYSGADIIKYLLRVWVSDQSIFDNATDIVLYIDRHRRKANRTDHQTRLAGWKHPLKKDWNNRIFEVPLSHNGQVIDFGQEYFFKNGDFPIPVGDKKKWSEYRDGSRGWIDLAFRLKYTIGGQTKFTTHIGFIRMYGIFSPNDASPIISYAIK